jgi:uncharacterized membrane protein YozB (DUF420 family)
LSGIFGTSAVLITDLNLIVQIIAFILVLIALVYKAKGKFKIHGSIMGVAVILHFVTFIVAMGPSFVTSIDFFMTETSQLGVQTLWVHALTGVLSLVLGFFLVFAWITNASKIELCFRRKRIMDATMILWALSLVFGIATYLIFYI